MRVDCEFESSGGAIHLPRRSTRYAITTILTAIAALTFAFSFGNTPAVGLRLGVEPLVVPPVGPAVELYMVGLLAGTQYAVSQGVRLHLLRPARVRQGALESSARSWMWDGARSDPSLHREIHAANTDSPDRVEDQ